MAFIKCISCGKVFFEGQASSGKCPHCLEDISNNAVQSAAEHKEKFVDPPVAQEELYNQAAYCPQCGAPLNSDGTCSACGYSLDVSSYGQVHRRTSKLSNPRMKRASTEKQPKSMATNNQKWRIMRLIIFLIFAVFIIIAFEIAADLIARGGRGIGEIESVGGRTLEEAYYYELQFVYKGYSLAVRTFGKALAVIFAYLGGKK